MKKPYERFAFNTENKNMSDHWIGIFSKGCSGTKIEFTEAVETTSPIMNLFVKSYRKKQHALHTYRILCANPPCRAIVAHFQPAVFRFQYVHNGARGNQLQHLAIR